MRTQPAQFRSCMLMATLLFIVAAMLPASNTAFSQITGCRFEISNGADCTIRAYRMNSEGRMQGFDITPGLYTKSFPEPCPTVRFRVKDVCGNGCRNFQFFPEVAGQCITIPIQDPADARIHCVRICYTQERTWAITPVTLGNCPPCN